MVEPYWTPHEMRRRRARSRRLGRGFTVTLWTIGIMLAVVIVNAVVLAFLG